MCIEVYLSNPTNFFTKSLQKFHEAVLLRHVQEFIWLNFLLNTSNCFINWFSKFSERHIGKFIGIPPNIRLTWHILHLEISPSSRTRLRITLEIDPANYFGVYHEKLHKVLQRFLQKSIYSKMQIPTIANKFQWYLWYLLNNFFQKFFQLLYF